MFDVKDGDYFDTEEELFESVLEKSVHFRGSVRTRESMMIRGTFEGSIDSEADIVVDEGGFVKADIKARRILVKGEVEGDIRAKEMIFVSKRGKVTGNITSVNLILEPGSVFVGKCIKPEGEAAENV